MSVFPLPLIVFCCKYIKVEFWSAPCWLSAHSFFVRPNCYNCLFPAVFFFSTHQGPNLTCDKMKALVGATTCPLPRTEHIIPLREVTVPDIIVPTFVTSVSRNRLYFLKPGPARSWSPRKYDEYTTTIWIHVTGRHDRGFCSGSDRQTDSLLSWPTHTSPPVNYCHPLCISPPLV